MLQKHSALIAGLLTVMAILVIGGIWFYGTHRIMSHSVPQVTISQDDALKIVEGLPAVKQWLSLFTGPNGSSPSTGGFPAFSIVGETSSTYTIQAFENMADHISTFGFYDVDKITGTASASVVQ